MKLLISGLGGLIGTSCHITCHFRGGAELRLGRSIEKRINSFSNYTAEIEHDGNKYSVHFMGLFSEKKDAQPIIMTHGWPGEPFSILEMSRAESTRVFPRVPTSY